MRGSPRSAPSVLAAPLAYLVVCVGTWVAVEILVSRNGESFAGVYLILLAAPWSFALLSVETRLLVLLGLGSCMALNAGLLWWVGYQVVRRHRQRRSSRSLS